MAHCKCESAGGREAATGAVFSSSRGTEAASSICTGGSTGGWSSSICETPMISLKHPDHIIWSRKLLPLPLASLHINFFLHHVRASTTSTLTWPPKTPLAVAVKASDRKRHRKGHCWQIWGRQYLCWWNREQTTSKTRESWILRKGHLAALKSILSFKCQPQYQWLNLDFLGKKTIRGPNDSFSRTGPGAIDRNIWSPRKAFRRQPFTAPNPALLATICFHTQPFSTLSIHSTRRNCPRAAFSKNTYGFFLCLNLQTQTSLWTCKGNISWYIECLWYIVVLQ